MFVGEVLKYNFILSFTTLSLNLLVWWNINTYIYIHITYVIKYISFMQV